MLFWPFFIPVFIIGAIIGSFLNCVIWRSYRGQSVLSGRSYCPKCHHQLAWFDLVPIFSFLALAGKCRYCRQLISWQYPLIEIATGVIFVASTWLPEMPISLSFLGVVKLLAYWVILSAMIVVFVTDWRWYLIPDGTIIVGLTGALVLRSAQSLENFFIYRCVDWSIISNSLLAAVFAASFFLIIFWVSRGRWLGFGDVKFAFLMGVTLGFFNTLIALFFANFFGAIIGLGLIFSGRKKMSSEIPFGPFLVVGAITALFFGDLLLDWYLL